MEKEKIFTDEQLTEMTSFASANFIKKARVFDEMFGKQTFDQRQSNLVVKIVELINFHSQQIDDELKQISEHVKQNKSIKTKHYENTK